MASSKGDDDELANDGEAARGERLTADSVSDVGFSPAWPPNAVCFATIALLLARHDGPTDSSYSCV